MFGFSRFKIGMSQGSSGSSSYSGPDIVLVGYGQSNWLRHVSESSTPDAASAGTFYWDDEWTTVPTGNGVRALLNAIKSEVGDLTVGLVSAGESGVNIADLLEGAGTGYYETLASRILASGARNAPEAWVIIHHGEGDANTAAPSAATYRNALNTLHGSISSDLSRTRAQAPMLVSSIATVDSLGAGSSVTQAIIQSAIVTAHDTYPNIHYSHSNLGAALTDGIHWDAAAYERSGAWYARTLLDLRGDVSTSPAWFISSATIVDATHTDITVVHSMGTDFTPTTGITGFEISNDNWATSATISAAARSNATTIRLTHDDLGLAADRLVRYQYAYNADVSGLVVDNSSLAAALNHSAHQTISAEGAGIDLGVATTTEELLALVMETSPTDIQVLSATITPNAGSPISATIEHQARSAGLAGQVAALKFVIPNATSGTDNCTLDITYDVNPFTRSRASIWTVPTGDLSSTTKVDSDGTTSSSATALTRDISTSDGGFYIAGAVSNNVTANSCTWTADESIAERADTTSFGAQHTYADASGTVAGTNDNTITSTFAASGAMALLVVSYR
jgi:hypothetical protein